jgi:hypothetical protein
VSVCRPVQKIAPPVAVCAPVKVCTPVTVCGQVDGHVKHVTVREHVLVAHRHREHRGRMVVDETSGTTRSSPAPSAAPQLSAPPAPLPANG